MNHIKLFEQFGMSESLEFKDVYGKVAKVGDFIKRYDDTVGKVKRIFKSGSDDRMEVDFRSHFLELNHKSKFEIIEDKDGKLDKAFEKEVNENLFMDSIGETYIALRIEGKTDEEAKDLLSKDDVSPDDIDGAIEGVFDEWEINDRDRNAFYKNPASLIKVVANLKDPKNVTALKRKGY